MDNNFGEGSSARAPDAIARDDALMKTFEMMIERLDALEKHYQKREDALQKQLDALRLENMKLLVEVQGVKFATINKVDEFQNLFKGHAAVHNAAILRIGRNTDDIKSELASFSSLSDLSHMLRVHGDAIEKLAEALPDMVE